MQRPFKAGGKGRRYTRAVFSGRSIYEVVNKTVNGILPFGRFVPALIMHYKQKLRLVIVIHCLEPTVQEQGSLSRIKIGLEAGIETGMQAEWALLLQVTMPGSPGEARR